MLDLIMIHKTYSKEIILLLPMQPNNNYSEKEEMKMVSNQISTFKNMAINFLTSSKHQSLFNPNLKLIFQNITTHTVFLLRILIQIITLSTGMRVSLPIKSPTRIMRKLSNSMGLIENTVISLGVILI
jgi:hypothetical protein